MCVEVCLFHGNTIFGGEDRARGEWGDESSSGIITRSREEPSFQY